MIITKGQAIAVIEAAWGEHAGEMAMVPNCWAARLAFAAAFGTAVPPLKELPEYLRELADALEKP